VSDRPTIDFSSISERDIDFLLMEEFATSFEFTTWFLRRSGLSTKASEVRSVRHSVSTDSGESDLELELLLDDGSVCLLLIEDKIGAPLQPRQAERYRTRGDEYVSDGACDIYHTIIVAPGSYFVGSEGDKGFDARVILEDVRAWFERGAASDHRCAYKAALLLAAIERARRGYERVADATVTEFWRRYWDLARECAPDLQMPRPEEKPYWSSFVTFRPPDLPGGVRFVHKVRYGHVDLELGGQGDRLDHVHAELAAGLPRSVSVERASKSAALRIDVPAVEMTTDWAEIEPVIRQSLAAALELLGWLRESGRAKLAELLAESNASEDPINRPDL